MKLIRIASALCTVAAIAAGICGTNQMLAQAAAPAMQMPMKADATKKPMSPPMKAEATLPSGKITVDYSAPSARDRKIFGGLVPFGEVWRTGANAATTLKTSSALQIGDLNVPAGTYTLYSVPTPDGWTLIVNKQTGQWGTVYDVAQDLGRVKMSTATTSMPVETFVIDFEKTTGDTAELHLKWVGVDAYVLVTAVK